MRVVRQAVSVEGIAKFTIGSPAPGEGQTVSNKDMIFDEMHLRCKESVKNERFSKEKIVG